MTWCKNMSLNAPSLLEHFLCEETFTKLTIKKFLFIWREVQQTNKQKISCGVHLIRLHFFYIWGHILHLQETGQETVFTAPVSLVDVMFREQNFWVTKPREAQQQPGHLHSASNPDQTSLWDHSPCPRDGTKTALRTVSDDFTIARHGPTPTREVSLAAVLLMSTGCCSSLTSAGNLRTSCGSSLCFHQSARALTIHVP